MMWRRSTEIYDAGYLNESSGPPGSKLSFKYPGPKQTSACIHKKTTAFKKKKKLAFKKKHTLAFKKSIGPALEKKTFVFF